MLFIYYDDQVSTKQLWLLFWIYDCVCCIDCIRELDRASVTSPIENG